MIDYLNVLDLDLDFVARIREKFLRNMEEKLTDNEFIEDIFCVETGD
jgi:hypothetical protein